MDKVKAVLHSNKEDPETSTSAGPTGRMTGQGSHFPKAEDTNPSANIAGLQTDESARRNPDDGLGTAAIGTTSTYSSHHLAKGDPVGNVADPQSADPTTYKMPEHMYGSAPHTGVPEGAAGTAASLAFNKDRQQSTSHIPGAFPKDESSTYDSTQAASAATSGFNSSGATRDPYGARGLEAAAGGAAGPGGSSGLGQGISAAAAGAATENAPSRGTTHDATTVAPSSSTATTSPADRSADYSAAEKTKVPDEAAYRQTSSTDPATSEPNQSGTFGKILGAMGLGAAAGGATAAATRGGENQKPDVVSGTPDQPTTTTGVSSYTAPTESTPSAGTGHPPAHYRKESIPTSAYPAGQDSPAPINPPVGGTAAAATEPEHKDHTGRNAGLAAAGVGAGAYGAHELGKQRSEPGEINEYNIGSGAQGTSPAAPYAPATNTGAERGVGQSQPATAPYNDPTANKDSKGYGKAAAAAGLGAGAAGAGAYALGHEKNKPETGDLRADKPYTSPESTAGPTAAATSQLPVREKQPVPATTASSAQYPRDTAPATDDRHTGRDAALAGAAGAGASAYGVHEYNKHRAEEDPSVGRQAPMTSSKDTKATPVAAASKPTVEKTTKADPTTRTEQEKSHAGRDAALAGTAGAGAGAYGVHEYDKRRAEQDPSAGRQAPPTSTRDTSAPAKDTKATPVAASSVPTSEKATKQDPTTAPEQDKSHGGRDAALAGAAGAGAGAYGVHEYNKHEAEQEAAKAEAQRQKDLAEQEAARQRQFEKDQKAAEKQAHKEEKQHQKEVEKEHKAQEKAAAKEEKKHQKELEKEEKKHQKEIEKEEKQHNKEFAAAEAEREKQLKKEEQARVEAEEAEKHKREKEAAAAAAVGGSGAAAAYGVHEHDQKRDAQKQHEQESLDTAHDIGKRSAGDQGRPAVVAADNGHNVLHKDPPEEKKPNIFKRIFKRRKNKDTGEEEEYSTDEEDHGHGHHDGRHVAEAGAVGAGAGAGAGVAGAETARHEPSLTSSTGTSEHHHPSSYEEQSGGLQKPSYNPFSKQDPTAALGGQHGPATTTTTDPGHEVSGTGAGMAGTHDTSTAGATTGPGTADPHHTSSGDPENMGGIGGHQGHEHREGGIIHRIKEQLKPLPDDKGDHAHHS